LARAPDLAVLFEHPEWQEPLFAALSRRPVPFVPFDLKRAALDLAAPPVARVCFNQASPSAYVRGNTRAVPFAMALIRSLELAGSRVINGSRAFALELSKSAQADLLRKLGIATPRSMVFNDVEAVRSRWSIWPALLKPEQGGSGARMVLLHSFAELERTLELQPELWLPDNLLLLQEHVPYDVDRGIVRMEFVGGELLYGMRVVSHGAFNLCPSEVCNPDGGEAASCPVDFAAKKPIEFHPYPELPPEAARDGLRIMAAGGIDVGGIEYLEAADGRRVFYDVNANSNLRPAVARAFGFDPFERVVDYLVRESSRAAST